MKTNTLLTRTFCALTRLTLLLTALALLAIVNSAGAAPGIVVPNSAGNTEGNLENGLPFNSGSSRIQQLFVASQFSALNPGGAFITQILFRPDANDGFAFNGTFTNIQINMSITSVADDALSTTFANNIGLNETIVYGSGPLSLSSSNTGPAGGPKDFDVIITLSTPFFYNPALGNLLIDVRNFSGGANGTQLDAVQATGDGVSRVGNDSNANSATANFSDSVGLVTGFNFVPEPSTYMLFAGGAASLLVAIRRRRK